MKKDEVSRDSKLKIKLRTSEAKRVVAVRELGEARKEIVRVIKFNATLEAEIKKLKKEAGE